MNTKFIFFIFVFLTGTVLAQDVPPIVHEALTQKGQLHAEENKTALRNLPKHLKHADKEQCLVVQNNKDKNPAFELLDKIRTFLRYSWVDHALVISIVSLGVINAYLWGYNQGLNRSWDIGHERGYDAGFWDGSDIVGYEAGYNTGTYVGYGTTMLVSAMNGLNGQI